MKHVGKIYILLGIIFICLVIPVNTNEGFKRRKRRNYKNSIKSMTCEELKNEKEKYQSGSYQHGIANNMYTYRNCIEIEEIKKDQEETNDKIDEVDENALKVSDISNDSPSSVN